METIKLDLIPGKKMPSLHASQYDDGREHGIDLFENGVVYKLDGTETLTINERKGDNCICSLDIENTFADSNHIVFASTEQMCAVWGNNICELVITKGEKTIGTLNFILEIEPSPTENGIESESEISNLERQIEKITEQVIGDDYYTAEETDEAIATATEGKADTTYVDTELAKKADKSNTYTKSEVDTLIDNLPEPMIFKGTLGVGGTIQTLPTASASNEGWTFKCITAGTYAGLTLKVGDTVTCFNPPNTSNYYWDKTGSQDTDTDTWRNIKVNGVEKLGNGISSGAVDFVGSENIEVEFDGNGNKVEVKTKNIYTKNEVDDIVYNILPDDTASGAVANFNTSLALPLKSAKFGIIASGGGGTPTSPINIVGVNNVNFCVRGSNLWNEQWELGGIDATTGQNTASNTTIRSKDYISVLPNMSVYLVTSKIVRLRWYDKNKTCFGNQQVNSSNTVTIPSNCYFVRFVVVDETSYQNNISINYPSTDTTYHAYTGETYTKTFNACYGGKLNLTTGALEVDWVSADLSQLSFTKTASGLFATTSLRNSIKFADSGYTASRYIKSSHFNVIDSTSITGPQGATPSPNGFMAENVTGTVYFNYTDVTTVEEFKTAMQGVNFIYELATPFTIDLPDGEPIITLAGVNNIFADTGDTEVVFKCSVEDYVSAHSGGNLLGMGGVYLGGAKSGGGEEETNEGEDTEKVKLDETKVEIKAIVDTKKLGGE